MAPITKLAVLSAIVASAAALPQKIGVPFEERGAGKFTVKQTIPKNTVKNGAAALADVYTKYNVEVPSDVKAAAAAASGSVVATPGEYDISYLIPVTVGTTTLNLDLDTGSADLWVFSSEQSASSRSGHSYYTPGSTASKLSGYTWSISYGDGSSASGDVYTDKVVVGGVTATKQAVEAAKTVSAEFQQDTDTDGLIGLAFSSINTVSPKSQSTFFDNVKSSLASPVFTADLKKGVPGSYDFGYIDSSKYTGSVTYVSVDSSQGFWTFATSGYGVGTTTTNTVKYSGIADTGTTLLLLPAAVNTAYYAKVSGAQNSNTYGGYVFPCSSTLPSLTFNIGGYKATIPGTYMNYAPVTDGSSTCYGGLQSSAGIGINIFGDIFLKSQFVVFQNAGTPQIGFAAKST